MAYGVFTEADRARSRQIELLSSAFVQRQVAKGIDPSVPTDRREPSDYNQHGCIMEASGADQDRFFRAMDRIMTGDPLTAAAPQARTGAMVAFVPSAADCRRLAIEGFEVADDLHMTAAYLGEAVDWPAPQREQLLAAVSEAASGMAPIEADGFAVSMFNPTGDQPAIALGVSGAAAADAQSRMATTLAPFAANMPEQHKPMVCHVTLAYANHDHFADNMDQYVDRCGPVTFDRLRVAYAGESFDFALTGSTLVAADTIMEAAAVTTPTPPTDVLPVVVQPIPLDVEVPEATGGTPFTAVLAVEGEWTGDRRQFAPGSLTWAPLPLQMKWQPEEEEEHDGAVVVGRIDTITRNGALIEATGVMDDGPDGGVLGCELVRLMRTTGLRGVSIRTDDTDDIDVEVVYPQPVIRVDAPMDTPPELAGAPVEPMYEPMEPMVDPGEPAVIIHAARIRSATILSESAFVEAMVMLADTADMAITDGTATGGPTPAEPPLIAAGHTITLPEVPPDWWFDEPRDVEMATALTVTDEGRIYGLLAPANTAHRAYRGKRLTVPMGNVDYSRFLGRQTIVAGGGRRVTGVITMDCGHCPPGATADPAKRMEHYDNSCSVIADINIGESPAGPWVAGALKHYATAEQVSKLNSCVLSGDWAPHPEKPGQMEFVAALLVPVPGFPKSTPTGALVASADPSLRINETAGTVVASVPVLIASAGAAASPGVDYRRRLDRLARSIGRDPMSRLEELRNRVHRGGE